MDARLRLSAFARRRATSRGPGSQQYGRHSLDPSYIWPDEYPLSGHRRRAIDSDFPTLEHCMLPRAAYRYTSVIFCSANGVLLFRLNQDFTKEPNVWSTPMNTYAVKSNPLDNAVHTLLADTGIDLPAERFRHIEGCPVVLSDFSVQTVHEFFLVQWTDDDGTMPDIPLPNGAAEYRFFRPDSLPVMSIAYCKELIEDHAR